MHATQHSPQQKTENGKELAGTHSRAMIEHGETKEFCQRGHFQAILCRALSSVHCCGNARHAPLLKAF